MMPPPPDDSVLPLMVTVCAYGGADEDERLRSGASEVDSGDWIVPSWPPSSSS